MSCLRVCPELLELFQFDAVGEAIPLGEHGRDFLGQVKHFRRFLVVVDLRQGLEQAVYTPGGNWKDGARTRTVSGGCLEVVEVILFLRNVTPGAQSRSSVKKCAGIKQTNSEYPTFAVLRSSPSEALACCSPPQAP